MKTASVIGIGKLGLCFALTLEKNGYEVVGTDINPEYVDSINDKTLSSDEEGVENLLKILYTLDDQTNVFVISHKGEILDGKFNNKIEFVKEKNFSKIKRGLQANELVL